MITLAHMDVTVADGTSSATVAWFTLASALDGVLVTGIVSMATGTLNRRWQSQSTRRQRLKIVNSLTPR